MRSRLCLLFTFIFCSISVMALAATMDELEGKWRLDRGKLPAELQKDFAPMTAHLENKKNSFILYHDIKNNPDNKRTFIYSVKADKNGAADVETIDRVMLRFEKTGPSSMSVGEIVKDGSVQQKLYFIRP